jgi:hypothetical protein
MSTFSFVGRRQSQLGSALLTGNGRWAGKHVSVFVSVYPSTRTSIDANSLHAEGSDKLLKRKAARNRAAARVNVDWSGKRGSNPRTHDG